MPTTAPRWQRRALSVAISLSLATAGLASFAPTTSAAPQSLTTFTDGAYVVLLADPAAAAYEGGEPGYSASRPSTGKKYGGSSATKYEGYLTAKQDKVLKAVGATARYRYAVAANGFSANLSAAQAAKLAGTRGVLSVARDEARAVDTTSSPAFLGLTGPTGTWASLGNATGTTAGKGVVVGIIDTGIWPESASFAGAKLGKTAGAEPWISGQSSAGPVTSFTKSDGSTFTGLCENGKKWVVTNCSTKLVSARYFEDGFLANVKKADRSPTEYLSARDGAGHGSHTASTAAGNAGVPVSIDGDSFGTASGMAPAAKVAAYKVCWEDNDEATGGCYTSDSIAAINQAVIDGVDVLNYSISGATTTVVDAVEYAFFGAAAAGIFVAASAGNSGPIVSTVAHNSPWLTTVAASTHTRTEGTVVLGNGAKYKGASIRQAPLDSAPLVLSTAVGVGAVPDDYRLCKTGSLDPAKVAGKIVVCDRGVNARVEKSAEVKRAGGVGMILANTSTSSLDSDVHTLPTVHVDNASGAAIKTYAAGGTPTASFAVGDTTGGSPTPLPQIAGFSSRGPALSSNSDLLKPDISAPGVSVIAAVAPPSNNGRSYDVYSGTSMSSPHIAGLAALFFTKYPTWTPQMVKSAMMTTAYDLKGTDGTPSTDPFAQGAGHVDPTRFLNPGLVVTSSVQQWAGFYAGQGLQLGAFAPIAPTDLNVPSIAASQVAGSQTITRSFTALQAGTWKVSVSVRGFTTSAPKSLTFAQGESKPCAITFTRAKAALGQWAKGFLILTGPTTVRLPIALKPVAVKAPAEVSGTGVSGSVPVTIVAGDTGNLAITTAGLAAGVRTAGSIPSGSANAAERTVVVPAGTTLARFDVDAAQEQGDFDLYVYRLDATGEPVALAGQSATGAADERVDLKNPAPASYLVVIENFATVPGETTSAFTDTSYVITPATTLGALTATPNPVPVTQGSSARFDVSWTGLTTGTPYLGVISYGDSAVSTVLSIS